MSDTITATVEIIFPTGKDTIEMLLKEREEITECQEGTLIVLNLVNRESVTGIFKGIDGDEEVMLGSLSSKNILGYNIHWLLNYWEKIPNS